MMNDDYPELALMSLAQLIAVFEGEPYGPLDAAEIFFDQVAIPIAQQGEPGISYLEGALGVESPHRVAAAIFGLRRIGEVDRFEPRILTLLRDAREIVVTAAIRFLMAKKRRTQVDSILRLRDHPSPLVRMAVLDYMSFLFPDQAFPILLEALESPDARIRWTASDGLGDIGWREGIEHLEALLDDPDEDVREKARWAIKVCQE